MYAFANIRVHRTVDGERKSEYFNAEIKEFHLDGGHCWPDLGNSSTAAG
jgi:hypothetical protein